MEKQQLKDRIIASRLQGLSYQEIAEETGTTSDYVRTVYSRANRKKKQKGETLKLTSYCQECGKPLSEKRRNQLFCNEKCRYEYHNRRKEHVPYTCVCEICGQEFIAYGNPKRRFCSSNCRNKARSK